MAWTRLFVYVPLVGRSAGHDSSYDRLRPLASTAALTHFGSEGRLRSDASSNILLLRTGVRPRVLDRREV